MEKKLLIVIVLVLLPAAIIAGCMMKENLGYNKPEIGIANPAAVYCL